MNTAPKFLIACLFLALGAGTLAAQAKPLKATKPAEKAEDEKKQDDEEEKDRWLHVSNVDVFPVVGPVIRGGEILIKNSKIEAIGHDLDVPDDAEMLDGMGFRAYPGLVALNGAGIVPRASGKIEDSSHPNGIQNILALAHGITTVVTGSTAVKIQTGTVEDYVLRKNLFTGLSYSSTNPQAKVKLEQDLRKARDYLRKKRAGELEKKPAATSTASKRTASSSRRAQPKAKADSGQKALGSAARYLPLLEGKATAVFNVASTHQLRQVAHLVKTFGFRAVVRGAAEGWTLPGEIGRAGMMAIVSPRERRDPNDRTNRPTGSTIENAAILYRHGVEVAISSIASNVDLDGSPGRDGISLLFDAGAAVGGGLPEDEAIRAITINAAKVYQLEDRIGSLEVGKDADIVILDGELLHYASHVQWAIVNGRLVYDKEKEPMLKHIRSRDKDAKPSKPWWPRPFGEMPEEWTYDPAKVAAEREAAEKKDHDEDSGEKDGDKPKEAEKKDSEDKKEPKKPDPAKG